MTFVVCKTSLDYLCFSLMWPKSENITRKSYILKYSLLFATASPLLILNILHLIFFSLRERKYADLTGNAVVIASRSAIMYLTTTFVLQQDKLKKVIAELSNFEKFGKPTDFDKRTAKLDRVAIMFHRSILIAAIGVNVSPVLNIRECEKLNQLRRHKDVCGLAAGVWLPFDFGYFPLKQIIAALQFYCDLIVLRGGAMLSLFIMEVMEHFIIRFNHLKVLIEEVVRDPDRKSREKKFGNWLRYHIHILSLAKEMDEGFRRGLIIHVVVAGFLFGCMGHSLMTNMTIATFSHVSLFFGWFTSVVCDCISGQRLMDESTSVALAAYNSVWYNTEVKFQQYIMLVITRARIPVYVNAGPISNLSHLIILKILQTAYSYLNLLGATSGKQS